MPAPILIVGQGLAGTMLGWAFERAGIEFEIADAGHARASSRVGAGIINPITGQRIVKSWLIDTLRPRALAAYAECEEMLGVKLVTPMLVRRFFRDEREREVFAEKQRTGELAPYAGEADARGFWIEGAARVDTAALIAAARARWLKVGRLREERVEVSRALARHELVILCTGADHTDAAEAFGGVSCVQARGEILEIESAGVRPGVILNDGVWLLPTAAGAARVGATYERLPAATGGGAVSLEPTPTAREQLAARARGLLASAASSDADTTFDVTGQAVGVRVTTPDRHPIVGRSRGEPRIGLFNGLGSKGALLAPWLAHQWMNHLTEGVPFAAEVDVARFRA